MVAILLIVLAQASSASLPSFEGFKVSEVFKGTPAEPLLKAPGQQLYRTTIREAAKHGPNFAGHYTIADWSLGSNIGEFAVIDAQTGTLRIPFRTIAYPPMFRYVEDPSLGTAALDFRVDSRMLLIRGCPGDKACGSYFFEWTGTRLKLLRAIPAVESH